MLCKIICSSMSRHHFLLLARPDTASPSCTPSLWQFQLPVCCRQACCILALLLSVRSPLQPYRASHDHHCMPTTGHCPISIHKAFVAISRIVKLRALTLILVCVTPGLVLEPLPTGAWAFLAVTVAVVTKTLSFGAAFGAFNNDVIWLIVVSFFFAKARCTPQPQCHLWPHDRKGCGCTCDRLLHLCRLQ